MKRLVFLLALVFVRFTANAEDGYDLWLRFEKISDAKTLQSYTANIKSYFTEGNSPTLEVASSELAAAFSKMTGAKLSKLNDAASHNRAILLVTGSHSVVPSEIRERLKSIGDDGYIITQIGSKGKKSILVTANKPVGVLYGTFALLRELQMQKSFDQITLESKPAIQHRILNHWDNLDRTVERGYAGFSLWDWHRLPLYIDQRYIDYARANASIGINGTVLTNVNANALVLTPHYLEKAKALADVFRPYGIKVYLTARFSAPIEIGKLPTADPLDPKVQQWWKDKATEIYKYIPDFGGFLVKANSEGQPGPQNYGRTHVDGANMLADAVAPHGGIVMWRAFVYDNEVPDDRVKQAYNEFMLFDGNFRDNVIIQVKNGPLDFQPREPFHPLFGAMKKTPLMMEFQITQEYLGFATHLVYLAPLFEETLDSDTWQNGKGSTVRKAIDGSLYNHKLSAIAGVANIGNDRNWCGHPIAQSNWYAYGRLAWNPELKSEAIASEWIRQTYSNDPRVVSTISDIMMRSRETLVNYMTPLGLHHIMGVNHHYGPGPWVSGGRADWTSVYYHRADSLGVGFNRTSKGSNALEQYHPEVRKLYEEAQTCPEEYLLWFHHLPWTYKTKSGRTLWDEMSIRYYNGGVDVGKMREQWKSLNGLIDNDRFKQVDMLLEIQHNEAEWWRDACLTYFQTFSKMPLPSPLKQPEHDVEYYKSLRFPYAPGIRPGW